MSDITITANNFKKFKTLYLNAVSKNQDVFMFGGTEVLTSFAKHVVEYLQDTYADQP